LPVRAYSRQRQRLGWSISGDIGPLPPASRAGSADLNQSVWDGIVGVKGRYTLGDDRKWFVPLYLDVGTGQSKLTWQISGGLGYSYSWGSVFTTWRYLDYKFPSGKGLDNISMSGPMLAVALQW
jgi:hypothetical protein